MNAILSRKIFNWEELKKYTVYVQGKVLYLLTKDDKTFIVLLQFEKNWKR
jgi:hypothetical protein